MAIPRLLKRGLLVVVGVACVLVLVLQLRQREVAKAEPSQVPAPVAGVRAEGSLVTYPGSQVTLGAEVAGRISELRVEEKDAVRKGQVIAQLDDSEPRAALAEARARISETQAQLHQYEADLRRYQQLRAAGVVSVQAFEQARRDRDTSLARLEEARAQVLRLQRLVTKSRIVSPIDGVVISRMVHPGEIVKEGTPMVVIADLSRVRVEAEVDEYDTSRVQLGAPVTITAEGFDGESWRGTVEDIPDAVVERRLRPQDPGQPVDTRVLRIKVAFAEPTPLKLGQRVELEIGPPEQGQPPPQARSGPRGVRPASENRAR